jgi:hypothetical protein
VQSAQHRGGSKILLLKRLDSSRFNQIITVYYKNYMLEKKVTRKEFLLSALSVVGLLLVSKLPSAVKKTATGSTNNSYGNQAYGGKKSA